jgi:hypothetical protein
MCKRLLGCRSPSDGDQGELDPVPTLHPDCKLVTKVEEASLTVRILQDVTLQHGATR